MMQPFIPAHLVFSGVLFWSEVNLKVAALDSLSFKSTLGCSVIAVRTEGLNRLSFGEQRHR